MKLTVVILSGAADRPVGVLGSRTPLEVARLPGLVSLAGRGRVGGVQTVPPNVPPSHEVALASLLAVDPLTPPPAAGALLASALGVELGPTERAFRCDLVNVFDGVVVDPTAGALGAKEAEILVRALDEELGSDTIRFRPGDRWRALLTIGGGQAEEVRTISPVARIGDPVEDQAPTGPGCELLRHIAGRAAEILAAHEINAVRVDLGENPASDVWIWGGGRPGPLPEIAGSGVAVGRHPSFLGIAKAVGLADRSPDRREGREADLDALASAAFEATEDADLTVIHVEGPLELTRLGDVEEKVRHLEAVDRRVIGPLVGKLLDGDAGRLMVVASHTASVETRRDIRGVVPFAIAGAGTAAYGDAPFTEAGAAAADLVVSRGRELLEFARRD